jgi:hypothetical protein
MKHIKANYNQEKKIFLTQSVSSIAQPQVPKHHPKNPYSLIPKSCKNTPKNLHYLIFLLYGFRKFYQKPWPRHHRYAGRISQSSARTISTTHYAAIPNWYFAPRKFSSAVAPPHADLSTI